MRLNANGHFEVDASINGHASRLIVDTGSSTTLLSKQISVAAGVSPAPTKAGVDAGGGRIERLSSGIVKELTIGSFTIANAEVALGNIANEVLRAGVQNESNAGLLGIEHLSLNFAVIDLGSMSLYLRHPDPR
jgi:predicted aspartyl protease